MTVAGLPVHPLVVHAVVMLIPLAALGAVLVAARPAWRQIYGVPTLVLAVVGLVCVPIATTSGTALAEDHGGHESAALELHMARADTVLPATIVFVVLLAAAVLLGRRADRAVEPAGAGSTLVATRATSTRVVLALCVLAALAGLVAAGLVALTGHAGATAVWGS
jgi:hypothetical protein